MARLLLVAASAALLASTSAAAAVLVVRSSGPSAAAYPPGKALPDTHMLKLKASDMIVLLDSRGTRTLRGPGNFSVLPAPLRPPRRAAVRGPPPAGSGWEPFAAPERAASGRPTSAASAAMCASPTRAN